MKIIFTTSCFLPQHEFLSEQYPSLFVALSATCMMVIHSVPIADIIQPSGIFYIFFTFFLKNNCQKYTFSKLDHRCHFKPWLSTAAVSQSGRNQLPLETVVGAHDWQMIAWADGWSAGSNCRLMWRLEATVVANCGCDFF
jgi:hypothetical protein